MSLNVSQIKLDNLAHNSHLCNRVSINRTNHHISKELLFYLGENIFSHIRSIPGFQMNDKDGTHNDEMKPGSVISYLKLEIRF